MAKHINQRKIADLSGQRFGKLVVIEIVWHDDRRQWLCKCDCGIKSIVKPKNLLSGNSRSCGCMVGLKKSLDTPDRVYRARWWIEAVNNRYQYTCQKCGSQDKNTLCAHHIESVRLHPELANDIDNGITLCDKCHIKFHFYYGRYEVDRRDLLKYLSPT
jgi:5-methylcytosine-specific restriction endonuclease McrA